MPAGDLRCGGSWMECEEGREIAARALARDIARCAELEAVLDGRASGCREVVSWQGLRRPTRWYVPEPWAGHVGVAAILFVSSNPSAGPREEPFDPARHMSRQDSDENLLAAADGAFDDLRFPGIADGRHNRDRNGRRTGPAVPFWRWTQGIARELLGRRRPRETITPSPRWCTAEPRARPACPRRWGPARAGICGGC